MNEKDIIAALDSVPEHPTPFINHRVLMKPFSASGISFKRNTFHKASTTSAILFLHSRP
jgi:hypothetical protein